MYPTHGKIIVSHFKGLSRGPPFIMPDVYGSWKWSLCTVIVSFSGQNEKIYGTVSY